MTTLRRIAKHSAPVVPTPPLPTTARRHPWRRHARSRQRCEAGISLCTPTPAYPSTRAFPSERSESVVLIVVCCCPVTAVVVVVGVARAGSRLRCDWVVPVAVCCCCPVAAVDVVLVGGARGGIAFALRLGGACRGLLLLPRCCCCCRCECGFLADC